MIRSKADLRREVEKLSSEYTAKDIFGSKYFEELMQSLITGQCQRLGRVPKLHLHYDEDDDFTAATQGDTVWQNSASPNVRELETLWKKYLANVGLATHEVGHVLFTDFQQMKKMVDGWMAPKFTFYPKAPKGGLAVKKYLDTHPNFRKEFIGTMRNIQNIEEDVYIENKDYQEFGGICTAGLKILNEESYRCTQKEKELLVLCSVGMINKLNVATSYLLIKKFGYEVEHIEGLPEELDVIQSEIEEVLKEADPVVKKLAYEDLGVERCKLLNELMVILFPLMPKPDENDENQDYRDSESQERQDSEGQRLQENGMSKQAEGYTKPVDSDDISEEEVESKQQQAEDLSKSEESMQRALDQASKEIAENEVLEKDEAEHTKELKNEADDIEKKVGNSLFEGYTFNRERPLDASTYRALFKPVEKAANNLYRKLSNILKDRQVEGYDSGYLMGQRFNATDVYRGDGKYFSREVVPEGQPNVAFGILIDESGSMSGENSNSARKIALLLEDVLRKLKVPLMIVGHDEFSNDCRLWSYVDFDTQDGKDKYRLCNVQDRYGNIDGAAITYMSEKLLKRPEEKKVLIVISDGLPAGCSFYDTDRNKDTIKAIEKYRKKDVKIFGAIVDTYDKVSKLYGSNYCFDCREFDTLQKEMCKLVKKYVLAK